MQEESGFVEQPLGRFDVLDHHAARQRVQLRIFFRRQLPAGKDDHGQVFQLGRVAQLLQHLEAGHVGQAQIEHDAVVASLLERLERSCAGSATSMSMSSCHSNSRVLRLLGRIVFDDQQPLAARLRVLLDARERRIEIFGRCRLGDEGECAARQAVMPVLIERQHLHGNVARPRILLEMIQDRPSEHVGQENIERDRGRVDTPAPATTPRPRSSRLRTLNPLSRDRSHKTRA